MDDELDLLVTGQRGVFSTADARSLGYTSRSISRMVGGRQWVRLRRGYYTPATTWAAANGTERHLLTARAVVRPLTGRVALTCSTGVAALGVEMWRPRLSTIDLLRLDDRGSGLEYGVAHHERPADLASCVRLDDDFLVAPPALTVATAMTGYPIEGAVVIADSAQNRGAVTKDELQELVDSWQRRPHTRALRIATTLSDGRAANGGETLGRIVVFWRQAVPRPELQFEIRGPREARSPSPTTPCRSWASLASSTGSGSTSATCGQARIQVRSCGGRRSARTGSSRRAC